MGLELEPGYPVNPAIGEELRPYLALWGAVLELAIVDAAGAVRSVYGYGHDRAKAMTLIERQAVDWFERTDDTGPGSFGWICELFNLRPEDVRQAIKKKTRGKHAAGANGRG